MRKEQIDALDDAREKETDRCSDKWFEGRKKQGERGRREREVGGGEVEPDSGGVACTVKPLLAPGASAAPKKHFPSDAFWRGVRCVAGEERKEEDEGWHAGVEKEFRGVEGGQRGGGGKLSMPHPWLLATSEKN
ncbi:hypothetical protein RUM43_007704 [Polyplax serrata]|uniref:Uncharacterized protein n=1 Tax=Polyplax serrata TaxID=468196 RepID=A0AAN8PD61_POLSC